MAALDDVKLLIKTATGYDVPDDDAAVLDYMYNAEVQHVLNYCNLSVLPDELQGEVTRATAAEYLRLRKAIVLGDAALNVAKVIQEGDTRVELGGTSDEERLDALINLWGEERDLTCFRRLRW